MSNPRILSKLPSGLANNSGNILTISGNTIIWEQNHAFDKANSAYDVATTSSSNTIYIYSINDTQNTRLDGIDGVNLTQNTSISIINGVNDTQNTNISSAIIKVENAYIHANASFDSSNTKFSSSGGTITGSVDIEGSLIVEGNLTVSGNVTTLSANNLTLVDNMIYLNRDANVANPDIGIAGAYNDGTYRHTGLFRDASDGYWKVFDQYLPEPDVSVYIDTSNSSFRIADFQANNILGNTFSGLANNSNYLNGYNSNYFTNASNISSGTLSNDRLSAIPNSSLANSTVIINGTTVSLGGSGTISAGATITDDVSTNDTRYVMLGTANSGSYTIANTSSTKLTYNPSTGILSATGFSGAGTNLTGTASSLSIGGSAATLTTARTLTIGSTGKTFNGSANVSWSLADIGAAATNQTMYIGTTAVAINRASATLSLTGVNIDGSAGSATTATTATTANATATGNSFQMGSLGVGTAASGTGGEIRATNAVTAYYSDKRLKNIFGEIPDALEKVEHMSGIYFQNNDVAESFGYTDKSQQVGVIAQEVQKEVPEAVKLAPFDSAFTEAGEEYSISGENYLTVQYEKLVPVLLQAIKELNTKVITLEEKLK